MKNVYKAKPRVALISFLLILSIAVPQIYSSPAIAKTKATKSDTAISMPVFYATNRQRFTPRSTPVYSKKRRNLSGLEYGECIVTVPAAGVDFNATRDITLGWHSQPKKVKVPIVSEVKSQSATESDFFEELKKRAKQSERVILFVHGYKSTFDGACHTSRSYCNSWKRKLVQTS